MVRTATGFGTAGFFILVTGGLWGQKIPATAKAYGAFGFPDQSGTRLLADSSLQQPATLHTALCSGGGRFPVQFERRQAEREGNSGRQTANNFDKLDGNVFTVVHGKVAAGASCFLASESLLQAASQIRPEQPVEQGGCDGNLRGQLTSARSRNVVNCWTMGRLPADRRLVLVEFARRDKDVLASVVLIDGARMIFADYPATVQETGSQWRVDDGGVLSGKDFQVVFLLQRGTVYTLGLNWEGTEGASLAVFVSNEGDRFTRVIEDYWYQAPM